MNIKHVFVTCACLMLLAGCSFAPKYGKPPEDVPMSFKELTSHSAADTNVWKAAEPKDNALRGKWWEMFGDTNLTLLEEQANVTNQTIAAAWGNLLAARAV